MPTATPRRLRLRFDEFCPPRKDGTCRCGCGTRLQGRERCWTRGHDAPVVERFKIHVGDAGTIRDLVAARDKTICALCALDTEKARASCWTGHYFSRRGFNATPLRSQAEADQNRARFRALGFPTPSRSWWQADHTTPLAEGGTHDLSNLRTLCIPCHRGETAKLAARLARARRAPAEHPTLGLDHFADANKMVPTPPSLTPPSRAVLIRGF